MWALERNLSNGWQWCYAELPHLSCSIGVADNVDVGPELKRPSKCGKFWNMEKSSYGQTTELIQIMSRICGVCVCVWAGWLEKEGTCSKSLGIGRNESGWEVCHQNVKLSSDCWHWAASTHHNQSWSCSLQLWEAGLGQLINEKNGDKGTLNFNL